MINSSYISSLCGKVQLQQESAASAKKAEKASVGLTKEQIHRNLWSSIPIAGNKVATKIDLTSMHFADISFGQCGNAPPKKNRFEFWINPFLNSFVKFSMHITKVTKAIYYTYSSFIYLFYLFVYNVPIFPLGKNPLRTDNVSVSYAFFHQATEKLQATLRELEAARVQLEAHSLSFQPGWLVGSDFGAYIFLPFISHHATKFHDVRFFRLWTLVSLHFWCKFFSYASTWLPCIVICKYRSLQEQHT